MEHDERERIDGYVTRSLPPADWTFIEKIKTLRALHGMTQTELADAAAEFLPAGMRISRRGISGLEAGNDPEFSWPEGKYVHPLHIIAIASALRVPPSYLDPTLSNTNDVMQIRHLLDSVDLTVDETSSVTVRQGGEEEAFHRMLHGPSGSFPLRPLSELLTGSCGAMS